MKNATVRKYRELILRMLILMIFRKNIIAIKIITTFAISVCLTVPHVVTF